MEKVDYIHLMIVFLKAVLEPVLRSIVRSNESCELDPDKLGKGENYSINVSNLKKYCELVFKTLLNNSHLVPK